MKLSKINRIVFGIIGILLLSFIGILYISSKDENIDFINAVSGISSFFVAILTGIYVYITSKQIEVANEQLFEMQKDRHLREQPLITIDDCVFEIERPRFFYTPPEDEYSFQSRYIFNANIKNVSSYLAVNIDADAEISVYKNDGQLILKTTNERINILPAGDTINLSIMFCGDEITQLYESLREQKAQLLPKLNLTFIYKNLCGGFFETKYSMYLVTKENDMTSLKMWHTKINAAYIEEKERLLELRKIRNPEHYDVQFEKIKNDFDKELGDDDSIVLKCVEIPEMFSLQSISKKAFAEKMEGHTYGRYVHSNAECCNQRGEHK